MRAKHTDIVISAENPFENCKLGREKYADILTSMLGAFDGGFVLGIDNKWGAGKTTFINMWEQKLRNEGYKTVKFNAWENDFEEDVLVALISELSEIEDKPEELFKAVLEKAGTLATKLGSSLVKSLAEKYIGDEFVKELIKTTTEVTSNTLSKEIEEYTNRKQGIKEFKDNLQNFTKTVDEEKPLIFIIDELDRCRPNYAVRVLECIKHLFSIENIIFVLSIDKEQLGHAICGVYGSDNINSEEYLRRFIDIEYSIPAPEKSLYSDYLFEYYDFSYFFEDALRTNVSEFSHDLRDFKKSASILINKHGLTIRQQEKIFAQARIALKSLAINQYAFPDAFIALNIMRVKDSKFYLDIKLKKLNLNLFQKHIYEFLNGVYTDDEVRIITRLEGILTLLYHNYIKINGERIVKYDSSVNDHTVTIDSKFADTIDNHFKLVLLEYCTRKLRVGEAKIDFLLKRIELTEDIKT